MELRSEECGLRDWRRASCNVVTFYPCNGPGYVAWRKDRHYLVKPKVKASQAFVKTAKIEPTDSQSMGYTLAKQKEVKASQAIIVNYSKHLIGRPAKWTK
jgi:hypothetical protein